MSHFQMQRSSVNDRDRARGRDVNRTDWKDGVASWHW